MWNLLSRVVLGPTVTLVIPSRPDSKQKVSTTTATTARTTATIVGAGGATTAMTTATAGGHRISEVRGPLARESATRNFLRASGLQPLYQDTIGTLTPAYGSRTTGSHSTPRERPTTYSSSRTCHSISATPRARGSNTCRRTRFTTRPTCVESSLVTSRAPTCAQ
jgi:hypothetical protein